MTGVTDRLRNGLIGLNRRTVGALLAIAFLLGFARFVDPAALTLYTASLICFGIWMTWFVLTFVQWMGRVDEEP